MIGAILKVGRVGSTTGNITQVIKWIDTFGKRDELLKQVGLDAEGIARRTLEFVRQTRHQYT